MILSNSILPLASVLGGTGASVSALADDRLPAGESFDHGVFAAWLATSLEAAVVTPTGTLDTANASAPRSAPVLPEAGVPLARDGTGLPVGGSSLPQSIVGSRAVPYVQSHVASLPPTDTTIMPSEQPVSTTPVPPAASPARELPSALQITPAPLPSIVQNVAATAEQLERGVRAGLESPEPIAELESASGSGLQASAGASRGVAPGTATLPTIAVDRPMTSEALAHHVVRMVQHGTRDARLHVQPANLGAVDIQLTLDGDSTHLALTCTHPAVRDALESAVPRLRELLGDVGLNLAQVDVEARDQQSSGERLATNVGETAGRHAEVEMAQETAEVGHSVVPLGLIDTFA